jgi:hypothetical protein
MTRIELTNCIIEGPTLKEISLADWRAEGMSLFGEDAKLWKFKCPNCGHVQTIADFIELRTLGIVSADFDPGSVVYYSCIGRFDTRILEKDVGTIFNKKSPCNYTNGGLFCLAERFVVVENGDRKPVFDFARES